MTEPRAHIKLKTKLCAALCELVRQAEDGKGFVKIIPYAEAKTLTEDQILARFDWHHFPIAKANGGPDTHWNIQPMVRAAHREETAKVTIPTVAKGKRITKDQEEFRRRLLAKDRGEQPAPSKWPPRKMQSRNTFARAGHVSE